MNNYQELNKNLKDLKLYQISIKLSEYIEKINENRLYNIYGGIRKKRDKKSMRNMLS